PVLYASDYEKEFILQTDLSVRGVGAVLSQADDEGEDHPIGYFSRKLLPHEEKYSTIEKECLTIKLSIQAFRVYLLGQPLTIQTDHRALEWLDRVKENNARLTRWS
uniref:Reverse transcriptase RNase H-like domain-containing protein n=1 Tax=Amphimedon queenslandica TaxID=400682 RepID=A0A1X7VHB9_AMPQE